MLEDPDAALQKPEHLHHVLDERGVGLVLRILARRECGDVDELSLRGVLLRDLLLGEEVIVQDDQQPVRHLHFALDDVGVVRLQFVVFCAAHVDRSPPERLERGVACHVCQVDAGAEHYMVQEELLHELRFLEEVLGALRRRVLRRQYREGLT